MEGQERALAKGTFVDTKSPLRLKGRSLVGSQTERKLCNPESLRGTNCSHRWE